MKRDSLDLNIPFPYREASHRPLLKISLDLMKTYKIVNQVHGAA